MPPSPDPGGAGYQCKGVFEFEGPFGGFVVENFHAEDAAGPTTESPKQNEGQFRNSLPGTTRAPFVEAKREKGCHVCGGEPNRCCCIKITQERIGFSTADGAWRVESFCHGRIRPSSAPLFAKYGKHNAAVARYSKA